MNRRTQRHDNMQEGERNLYLSSLHKLRTECINRKITLHPCADDYQQISEMVRFIDEHQQKWTDDPEYFHIKPATTSQRV